MKLQDHQQYVLDYFLQNPNQKGLMIIHGTGSGKTLTAVSISEKLRKYKEVIVLAPKSLHDNFKKDLNKLIHGNEERASRYKYISSNASNMIDKLESSKDDFSGVDIKGIDLNNKLVICDEFHNLLVAMSNGSKNASALYDMIMKSKNSKFIFLTATPIINSYYELIIGLNLCKGYILGDDKEKLTLFPEDENTFNKYFIDENDRKIKNINKLRNRMFGLISYYGDLYNHKLDDFYTDMKKTIKMEHFPDRLPIKVELVKMSEPQYTEYLNAREKERLESKRSLHGGYSYKDLKCMNDKIEITAGAITNNKKSSKSTSYRIKSRQLSNVYFPDTDNNVSNEEFNEHIHTYSPKILKIFNNLDKENKTIIYSNFVTAGIKAMAGYLLYKGYKEWNPKNKITDSKCFAFYTGEIKPEDRTEILKEFNKLNSNIKILLISSSGSEGLSTRNVRQVHIMEPYWNTERLRQVMYRAIRFHSHDELPESQKNVQVYIYLSVFSHQPSKNEEVPTDIHLFREAAKKYEINKQMMETAASVAIDCDFSNSKINFDCYTCNTNGKKLFINDLDTDMLTNSPCENIVSIKAKEIDIAGNKYFIDDNNFIYVRDDNEDFTRVLDNDVIDFVLNAIS